MALAQLLEGINNAAASQQYNSLEDELCVSLFKKMEKKLELMVIRTVQGLVESTIENLIRKVVTEEFELAQKKFLANVERNSGNECHRTEPARSLKLQFQKKLSLPIWTGEEIKAEGGTSMQVALVDEQTGQVIDSGPEALTKVEIVVLQGDEDNENENCTSEDFNGKIVREKEEGKSLLAGNVQLKLNKGICSLDNIKFRHDSSWTKSKDFKLGATAIDRNQIKEAKTESFTLKDRRIKHNKKHQPPSLSDDVSRLRNIRKGGANHKSLLKQNVNTVQDFLIWLSIDPEGLQRMTDLETEEWQHTVNHAQTCTTGEKVYCYTSSQENMTVIFNVVWKVLGIILESQFIPVDKLSETGKARAKQLLLSALEDQENLMLFDDEASLWQSLPHLLSHRNSSIPPSLENPTHYDPGPSSVIDEYNLALPDTPFRNNPSTSIPAEVAGVVDVGLESIHVPAILYEDYIGTSGVGLKYPVCNQQPTTNDADWSGLLAFIGGRSCTRQPASGTEMLARSQGAQKSWTTLLIVARWFAIIKRMVSPEELHTPKKQKKSVNLHCAAG